MNERLEAATPWLFVGGFLLVWELGCIVLQVPAYVLPRPTVVAASLQKQFGPILDNSWTTFVRTLLGFAIAVGLGLLLGMTIGSFRLIYRGDDLGEFFLPPGQPCGDLLARGDKGHKDRQPFWRHS